MTFEEWIKEVVDGLNDRESLMRGRTLFSDDNTYHKMKNLRECLEEAYEAGREQGRSEGDYMEGLEEGIKIGKLQP